MQSYEEGSDFIKVGLARANEQDTIGEELLQKLKLQEIIIILVSTLFVILIICITISFCLWQRKKRFMASNLEERNFEEYSTKEPFKKQDLTGNSIVMQKDKEQFGLNHSNYDSDSSGFTKRMIN